MHKRFMSMSVLLLAVVMVCVTVSLMAFPAWAGDGFVPNPGEVGYVDGQILCFCRIIPATCYCCSSGCGPG